MYCATPVPLPYVAEVAGFNDRRLDYYRQNDRTNALALNEKSFNITYAKYSINSYLNSYKAVKNVIEDTILDDNNNIVHYSLPNEISVVRLKLRYTYGR